MTKAGRAHLIRFTVFNVLVVAVGVTAGVQPGVLSAAHIDQGLTSEGASWIWFLVVAFSVIAWIAGNLWLVARVGNPLGADSK